MSENKDGQVPPFEVVLARRRARTRRRTLVAGAGVVLLAGGVAAGAQAWLGHRPAATVSVAATPQLLAGRWDLVATSTRSAGTTAVPEGMGAYLTFQLDGRISASDGINFFSGSYTAQGQTITVDHMTTTLVGYDGRDAGRSRVIAAMNAALLGLSPTPPTSPPDVIDTVTVLSGRNLSISAEGVELHFLRAGS
jgi:heat shock protein HslJ